MAPMASSDPTEDSSDAPSEEFRAVVPGRAALTELARGFLLVHQSNPDRALRFATTFLHECAGGASAGPEPPPAAVTPARRRFGRLPHGAVDPTNFPPIR